MTVAEASRGRLDRIRVSDGVLELTKLEQQTFSYTVTARFAGAPRGFVLEQRRPVDWRTAAPADAVVDGDVLKVVRTLEPAGRLELAVVLERPLVQSFALADYDPQELLLAFDGVEPPPELRTALARLQELAAAESQLQRRIDVATARRDELSQNQARLRENLRAVPPDSDFARRLLAELTASEDELGALDQRLADLRAELGRAADDRMAFVRSLRI